MKPFTPLGSICFALPALAAPSAKSFEPSSFAARDVITRDFAIVGGGAAGTYAAIALKDQGKSFVMVEKTDRLGGHAMTYEDPISGGSVDFGVQLYDNDTVVRDFFKRLNTPLADVAFSSFGNPVYSDFKAGTILNLTTGSLHQDYLDELAKYPYLNNGIELPNPVPEDLLLPWVDYVAKYNLQDSAMSTLARPAVPGHLLDIPALYVFNDLNDLMLHEDNGAAVRNANRDNSELYRNALTELSADILMNSTVISGNRNFTGSHPVRLVVKTPKGKKLIVAKQLIVGIPPTTKNMKSFGLDTRENRILSKIYGLPYYGGVISNTGLASGTSYKNYATNNTYNIADIPSVVSFNPSSVDGLLYYWYNSVTPVSQKRIEKEARQAIKMLQKVTGATTRPEPQFLAFSDFGPFHLAAEVEDIRNGFYRDMYALQGHLNTWYTGTLFVPGSSQVWNNTANMLPDILAAAK
ncbi:uncharacterized protein N7503_007106 [Penicillium pulvis]|uniref:uncharacterized protein n=1 Tax=Penicillium pulvis TaxID=1562058 RepID=UPI0025474775|nr:uncharacterized protein N7503_007106 [Penicillium pulvis]KAJ5797810.1 hypothetical protein N7503_007106 [Penicillium pulvis]